MEDINKIAKRVVDKATKNPAAVQMGKLGGKARAKALTPEKKSEIASKGARARWKKDKS